MKYLIEILKFATIAIAIFLVGTQFISSYKIFVRNAAIDGCAKNSLYQTQFVNAEKQTVTISEPQKELFNNCLVNKGVSVEK